MADGRGDGEGNGCHQRVLDDAMGRDFGEISDPLRFKGLSLAVGCQVKKTP